VADSIDIVIPDLGEFADVEIIEVLVVVGGVVAQEDALITLETDKATIDVPAPYGGEIVAFTVSVGDKVSTGDTIGKMTVEAGDTVAVPQLGETLTTSDSTAEDVTDSDVVPAATSKRTVVVPYIGDFSDVEIIELQVAVGDTVSVEDPLVTLETEKAAVDVPSPVAGVVESILVAMGDTVSAGSAVVIIDVVEASDGPAERSMQQAAPAVPTETPLVAKQGQPAALAQPGTLPAINEAGFSRAHAGPSVRKLARELGVDLGQVRGSGPKSRILHDDVKAFVKKTLSGMGEAGGRGLPKGPGVGFAKFGGIDVQALTRIQKISGPRLQASWLNLPHVTQHDLADITELEARRQELKGPAKERGISLTSLAFVLRACVDTLKKYPKVNASLSGDGTALVYKQYIHIGFAADTPNGLMVPVIRDVDQKDVYEIARELGELSLAAREGNLTAAQMQGASFTVSSLGGIGGTAFTPIVNAPEVAILGVSRASMQPVWNGSEFVPRLMLPLSFSYDHRVVDGAYAVRFTTYLGEVLADVDGLLEALP